MPKVANMGSRRTNLKGEKHRFGEPLMLKIKAEVVASQVSKQQVIMEMNINLPPRKVEYLSSTGFIVLSEFWQVLLDLDKSLGGMKDSTGLMGKKVFDLYHFNGIAKSIASGSQANEHSTQRPRLTKLSVSIPPRLSSDEFMAGVLVTSGSGSNQSSFTDNLIQMPEPQPAQHAPLVDRVKTCWPRAVCNWTGDAPRIV